ncbi:hypothetical protein LtaPh_0405800 [Leishmania tarentolae]|uniref:Uncharacterized protein n=1 Tax=Leishmania tarentolae TaxID=5689 RepID=A0A640K969_LEITA|nr:hypothetical protein LtaPh_0405800 [Leishmania tarentolae]
MRWFRRERPTTPIYIPDPRRPSIWVVLTSPEPALSMLLMLLSCYFLLEVTGSASLYGPGSLWQRFGRKNRAGMQRREYELLPDPPLAISFDMLIVVLCVFASNSFLAACSRVLAKEQRRVEDEAEAEWRAAVSDPETRHARLAKDSQERAEKLKLWQENDERRKAGQPPRRERITKVDVMADEVMTNIIVIVSVAVSLGAAYCIFMRPPNQVRGVGIVGILVVLMGGLIVCGLDRYISGMRHYCNYINLLCILALLMMAARASVLAD